MTINTMDKEEGTEPITHTQKADNCWTNAEEAEAPTRYGISPNHLFEMESAGELSLLKWQRPDKQKRPAR
jgi:hypothetical protein